MLASYSSDYGADKGNRSERGSHIKPRPRRLGEEDPIGWVMRHMMTCQNVIEKQVHGHVYAILELSVAWEEVAQVVSIA